MTETTFNGNLCIGTSYEELSDKNKEEYKPEHWTFIDTFPENITEVKGNIAIFNQLPTFPQDLKIAGSVAFHNIEFKETDLLPFKKSASSMDFSDCYGVLDIGGIDIDGNIVFNLGKEVRKLNIEISELVKVNCIDFNARNLSYSLKDINVAHFLSCRSLNGLKKIYPTISAENYYIYDSTFSSDRDFYFEFCSVDEIYEAFPHLVPDDEELQNKYGFNRVKSTEIHGDILPIVLDVSGIISSKYAAVYSKDKKLLKVINNDDYDYGFLYSLLPDDFDDED